MTHATEWLTSTQIAKRFRISRNSLLTLREKGVLQPGKHFITQGTRAIYDAASTEDALREYSRRVVIAGEVYAKEVTTA